MTISDILSNTVVLEMVSKMKNYNTTFRNSGFQNKKLWLVANKYLPHHRTGNAPPYLYVADCKIFQPDIQKPLKMENAAGHIQYFLKGIQLLVHRCEKCVQIKGGHIEKQQSCFTLKSWSGWNFLDPTKYIVITYRQ
jgi:hypothetical protein